MRADEYFLVKTAIKGGDLKLARMHDLLELSFILKTYDTAEEAVAKISTWLLLCLVRQSKQIWKSSERPKTAK